MWASAVSLVNGRVVTGEGVAESVRFGRRVLAIGERPRSGDAVVDLAGAAVLPGLINAHDHLELNHYGRLKFRETYGNATEWIDDMRPRLSSDPAIHRAKSHSLADRLFVGALKNLLAGVTTVAHHNPFYPELRGTMPVRVVWKYGWAHSFLLQRQPAGARGEPGGDVAARWRATRKGSPFIMHLAEGTDAAAADELTRLEVLGCLADNTVLVHGVAIDGDGWRRVAARRAGLVWCPASNIFLFGRTVPIRDVVGQGCRVALGTDSRITGARDLLDELRVARSSASLSEAQLLAMVTSSAADVLRLRHAGDIKPGAPADLVVVPSDNLLGVFRRDVRLVVVGGRPMIGHAGSAGIFDARRTAARQICVDGTVKLADAALVRRITRCAIDEPGVTA